MTRDAYTEGVMRRLFLVGVITAAVPVFAAAEPVQLTLRDGRVSLVATDVTVSEILTEWARIGGTRIVNGERVPGGRVTLQLAEVPEREALDLLLRAAAGYVAVQKTGPSDAGSRFARILILPTSVAPSSAAQRSPASAPVVTQVQRTRPVQVFAPSGALRMIGPDGEPVPDDQEGAPEEPPEFVPLPPGFAEPPEPPSGAPAPTKSATPAGAPTPGVIVPPPSAAPTGPREVQPIVVTPQP